MLLFVQILAIALTCTIANGQRAGTLTPEVHPPLMVQSCSKTGGCRSEMKSVVIDANWRWYHSTSGTQNCFSDSWDPSICPDSATCTKNCLLEGADYRGTYGVDASGSSLKIGFVTHGPYSTNVGARLYLLESENEYKLFKLKNMEFTFDVDVSKLPCGLNGALYLVEMPADGGTSKYPGNEAGAKYGVGYCDAQCPRDIKYINGEVNCEGWTDGIGKYGTCCTEMDIWEANSISTAYTPHVCTVKGQTRCQGSDCGSDGFCDKGGCDLNTYRLGNKHFYGPSSSFAVDSTKPITVVTQFITTDATNSGDLKEIRRLWVQNGKVIKFSNMTVGGESFTSITDNFCNEKSKLFNDKNDYEKRGGHKAMGEALERGMVLVMSLWDDHAANMLWLDSDYPVGAQHDAPGVARGPCPTSSGKPHDVESQHPDASVTFSNIRYGDLHSTYNDRQY